MKENINPSRLQDAFEVIERESGKKVDKPQDEVEVLEQPDFSSRFSEEHDLGYAFTRTASDSKKQKNGSVGRVPLSVLPRRKLTFDHQLMGEECNSIGDVHLPVSDQHPTCTIDRIAAPNTEIEVASEINEKTYAE